MRICHGLAGEFVDVEDQELECKKPLDVITQHVWSRWQVAADDIIILLTGGLELRRSCGSEELGEGSDVFIFLRSALDPQEHIPVTPLKGDDGLILESSHLEEELRLRASLDPALKAFHTDLSEAGNLLAGSRSAASIAVQAEAFVKVQRLSAQVVLDNLTSHREVCTRSMALFQQKYEKLEEQFDLHLGNVEAWMAALGDIALHPAVCDAGCQTLADLVPQDRISSAHIRLQEERAQFTQRVSKLLQQERAVKGPFDNVTANVKAFIAEGVLVMKARAIRQEHARADSDLLTALCAVMPQEDAPASSILEYEKRSSKALEDISKACNGVRELQEELQACWRQQHTGFLLRLREVAFVQSSMHDVESQAALLEEEINNLSDRLQKLGRLRKMPRAYQQMLQDIARRRQFRALYTAKVQDAREVLTKMMEEENEQRRAFLRNHGCFLPASLVQGLGSYAPPVTMSLPDFDKLLPCIDFASLQEEEVHDAGKANLRAPSFGS